MKKIPRRSALLAFIAAMLLAGCGKKEEAASPTPPPPPTQPAPSIVQVTKAVEEEKEAPGFQAIATLEEKGTGRIND